MDTIQIDRERYFKLVDENKRLAAASFDGARIAAKLKAERDAALAELKEHAATAQSNFDRFQHEERRAKTLLVEKQVLRQELELAETRHAAALAEVERFREGIEGLLARRPWAHAGGMTKTLRALLNPDTPEVDHD